MQNYVATNHRRVPDSHKTHGHHRRGAVGIPLVYGLPAFAYRTSEEQGAGGGNSPTGRNHRPKQSSGWTERLTHFFGGLTGSVEHDPDVQYAQKTVEKARILDSKLHTITGGNPLEYDVFGPPHRRIVGERK